MTYRGRKAEPGGAVVGRVGLSCSLRVLWRSVMWRDCRDCTESESESEGADEGEDMREEEEEKGEERGRERERRGRVRMQVGRRRMLTSR